MGVFVKDNFQGQFVDEWKSAFEKESFEKVRKLVLEHCNLVVYLFSD